MTKALDEKGCRMEFIKRLFSKKEEVSKEETKNIELPFEFLICNGKEAISKLDELREREDCTPIIMGSPKDIDMLIDNIELSENSEEEIISNSNKIAFPDWFKQRTSEDEEYYQQPHGEWPGDSTDSMELSAHLDVLSRKPLKKVLIGLIPTNIPSNVPAYLKFGGWNECPDPTEHIALFKRWEKEYSAKVACMTGDVIEFTVDNPPTDREQALKLAEEQFIYCSDIVFQGVGTIENLAATLVNSKVWYFWWD